MKDRNWKTILAVIITTIIIFFNITYVVYAGTEISFNNITIREGLPQGTVETLFQDSQGYIWFGTNDGLAMYNGYDFRVYSVGESCISNNYILDIKEDKDNNIWVGTASGLSKIHKDRKTITNYWADGTGSLSHNNIASILITKNNKILVATPNGLNLYNKDTDSFSRIFKEDRLVDQYINSLTEDDKGYVWVGTEGGVSRINVEKNTSQHFVYEENNKNSISSNEIYKVYYDSKGYIWGGTYSSGAFKISLTDYKITRYYHNNGNDKALGGNYIKSFLRDSNGEFWIGTDNGLSKYNEDNDYFTTYTSKIYDLTSLVNNNIFAMIEDNTGLIWIGTYAGISMFNPNSKIEHYKNDPFNSKTLTNNMVSTLYEDDSGILWIGTEEGIDIFSKERIKEVNIHSKSKGASIASNRVNYITGNGDSIFIGTAEGLNIINKTSKTIETYNESNGLPSRNIKHILYDNEYLWLSTDKGLAIFDIVKKEFIDLTYLIREIYPNDTYVQAVYKDSDDEYWVAMFVEGGLLRIDPNSKEIKNYRNDEDYDNSISNNSIRAISEDSKGNIWIGTSLGLNKFDKKTGVFTNYTTKDGLANNTVYSILIDKEDNPWVSTNKGISRIDTETDYITNLTILDGLQSNEFNGQAYFKNNEDEFFFGGVNGFNIITSKYLNEEMNLEGLIFHDFQVNGLEVDNIESKEFKYTENNIHIEVFLPNYAGAENIKYYYKVVGGNSEWLLMDGNVITLSNLAPGKYTFQAIATFYDGKSNSIEVNFTIKSPWWFSEEAMVAYVILILIYIVYSRTAVTRLDKLVAERTKELSDEMEKSEKLFNKVLELEKRKNTYLINMSHELRTPLNVIHSTEQLIRELNKSESGIEKENLNRYMSVMRNNVKRLLKIINDLIDTSKIEYGNYILNIEKLDIVYLVEETTLSLKSLIEKKGIELIIDPQIEEKIIEGDRAELERCIVNIVGNATKYTNSGGKIEVAVSECEDVVRIEICDTGSGIDKKYHEAIFNRFSQVVDNNAEVKGGSGLGLTITKKIIQLHKGNIYVESEVGKGSKFIIILPVSQEV